MATYDGRVGAAARVVDWPDDGSDDGGEHLDKQTDIVAGWAVGRCAALLRMNSAGHRANILNPGFTHIGVGATTTSTGRTYGTQNFLTL